ncbi:response regulator [Photobacterium leiognathi subsp. mandapamensis]|uniref:response regulator n=1 Tax=Photobacterium leiognathi TaxID=553611 RepID=UPI003AF37702
MNNETKILIIEDELPISRFLTALMGGHDYQIKSADNAKLGIQITANWSPHLILLDLGLPDMDGIALVQELRSWTDIPIIVISARNKESDKVAALDADANDYLTKPFGSDELLARVRVALRQAIKETTPVATRYHLGQVSVDLGLKIVSRENEQIKLTKTEYNILKLLCKNVGKVLTHKQILQEVWGNNYIEHPHYVRIHMAQLRTYPKRDLFQTMRPQAKCNMAS